MQNNNKIFPYPVLTKESDDILDSFLNFKHEIVENKDLICNVKVELKNNTLRKLIRDGKAAFVVHIECKKTRYRKTFKFKEYDFDFKIDNNSILNRVEIASMIVAQEEFKYTNISFNEDYKGDSYHITKNQILAYDEDISLEIERHTDSLENLPSIFCIVQNTDIKAVGMDYDLTDTKIKIKLNPNIFQYYKTLRINSNLEEILASLFIIPTLIKVLSDFEKLEEDYSSSNWYHSIKNRLKDLEITTIEEVSEGALKIAQMILGDTFKGSLIALEFMSLGGDE